MKLIRPPIKCQGIKIKLVPWIKDKISNISNYEVWYEPFMGSGAVGFNIEPNTAVFGDTNPHLIKFYNDIKSETITYKSVKEHLTQESFKLLSGKDGYYKEVRERFNKTPNSFDFIFLNRCCFNGMIRFNSNGKFNVPFCQKPNRLSKSYITKISNQIKEVSGIIKRNNYSFAVCNFNELISRASAGDIIYCDPPYIDRYCDYFNGWKQEDEINLFECLNKTEAKFILSTWHSNKYRKNSYIEKIWDNFFIDTKEHFYYLGASQKNRNAVREALVSNFKDNSVSKNKVFDFQPRQNFRQTILI